MSIPADAMKNTKLAPEILHDFSGKIKALSNALEQKLPNLGEELHRINEELRKYPELGHLLSNEQIGEIVKGIRAESAGQFAFAAQSGRGTKPKDLLKKTNLDDLVVGDVQI